MFESTSAKTGGKYSRIRNRVIPPDIVSADDIERAFEQQDDDLSGREFCKMSGDELSSEEESEEEEEEATTNLEGAGGGHKKRRRDDLEDDVESDETEEYGESTTPRRVWKRRRQKVKCACCELATSSLMKAMDSVMEKLAGKAGDRHITDMQIEIFEKRVKPLRLEGRDIPNINRDVIRVHYREHCVNVIRSVAEDIHTVELAERTLRRSGLCSKDDDDQKRLNSQAVNDLHKLSRTKLDLLKFFNSLEKARKEDELNGKA